MKPALAPIVASLALVACGGGGASSLPAESAGGAEDAGAFDAASYDDPAAGFDDATTKELEGLGWGKYIGQFTPSQIDDGEQFTTYTFAADKKGPICFRGSEFRMSTREAPSDDLLLFLLGGGACWTGTCAASTVTAGSPIPIGWTDGNVDQNPLGNYDLAFLGYCDGSVFAGDGEVADPAHGAPDGIRYHHGFANLTAGLDVAHARWPHPRRIVLAGSSAGGYGTIIATAVVRLLWPKTRLDVINDAGVGLTNPDRPEMYATIVKDWNLAGRIPADCTACQQGQFTPLIDWALRRDPTIRVAAFSSYEDAVIGGAFLGMEGPAFKKLLLQQTGAVHDAWPARFERFFIDGDAHTAELAGFYDLKVNGTPLTTWIGDMLDAKPSWQDELQNP